MEKAAGQLQVRVCDGTSGVITGHELVTDELRPFQLPHYRGFSLPPNTGDQGGAREPSATSTVSGGIMMTFSSWEDRH